MLGPRSPQAQRARLAQLSFAILVLALGWLFSLAQQPEASSGQLTLRVLDIGQGDALLLTTPHGRAVLIDGGPDNRVLSYLYRFLPTPHVIDLIIATHNHADHITGLTATLRELPTQAVWISGALHTTSTYEQFIRAIDQHSKVRAVHAGESVQIDGVTLRVLYPLEDMTDQQPENTHSSTIVSKVTYGATSFLLTGDLEAEDEQKMLEHERDLLSSTVLKVPHHGSHNASTDDFLSVVSPKVALVSVGQDNKFGHPHADTLERLRQHDIQILRTDQQGTITCRSNGITVDCGGER